MVGLLACTRNLRYPQGKKIGDIRYALRESRGVKSASLQTFRLGLPMTRRVACRADLLKPSLAVIGYKFT